ncbi:MAG: N-acetylmuramoyl-L-alanine amidase [Rubrobacter sp.]|nr:N-acetylmuramoyl-L-alanine amidase [Rubrobacter sp.]
MAGKPAVSWYPAGSGNFMTANRPSSNNITRVIVHVTQGSWSSALNWFQNPSAGVSAHFTIRSSDGAIGQSVSERNIGYHAGN